MNSNLTVAQKKAQILKQFNKVCDSIKIIEDKPEPVYFTRNKYLPQIGHIHELSTLEQVVKAKKFINNEFGLNDDVIAELGLSADEVQTEDVKLMGFPITKWNEDINTRIAEIRQETKLAKLYNDKDILTNNMSEDDKFSIAMSELSTIEWDETDETDETVTE